MKPDSPLHADVENRFTDRDINLQTNLFDQDFSNQNKESQLEDYCQRYGLAEDPFTDDPSFPLFTGADRRQFLDRLLHLCQFSQQLLVITGEPGVGKTRIAHALADSLEEQDQLCFLALSSGQSLEQILIAIAESFGLSLTQPAAVDDLLDEIETYLSERFSREPDVDSEGLALIIIDNAEHLDSQSLSVLATLVENKPYNLHLVLVGLPILVSRLQHVESEQLQISDFHLPAMSLSETVDYLNFRMEMADYLGAEIFTDAIVDPWWRQAHGRLSVIHEMAREQLLLSVMPQVAQLKTQWPVFHILAISAVITVASILYLYLDDEPAALTQVAVNSSLPVVTSSPSTASTSTDLTSSNTAVQPVLPALPVKPVEQVNSTENTEPSAPTVSRNAVEVSSVAAVVETATIEESSVKQVVSVASESASSVAADPVVPTNTNSRFTSDEQKILSWNGKHFTIQLLGVSNLQAAKEFVASQSNANSLNIFKTRRAGKDWFVVVTGDYMSNAAARSAIQRLPSAQQDAGPWPRQISVIQNEIRQR